MSTASIQRDVPITPPSNLRGRGHITTAVGALWKFLAQFEQMVQGFRVELRLKLTQRSLQVGGAAIFWQTGWFMVLSPYEESERSQTEI